MSDSDIPLAVPDLSGSEQANVMDALRSGWISAQGPYVSHFEKAFAEFSGTEFCLAVSNGTSALHLSLLGLGIGEGDEVIVPSLTYIATANAVRYVGATPIFAEVDPSSWCISPKSVSSKISTRTKAIIPVHLYGHPAAMDEINAIASAHGLSVIEDAAEAFGATYNGRRVGGLSDVGTFSFYGNKIITSGEGGAVTTNDSNLYERMKMLRGQGADASRRYYFPIIGYNFRPTNIGCAILSAQLERCDEILSVRHRIFAAYEERLAGIAGLGMQPVAREAVRAPWLFSLTIDPDIFGMSRDTLIELFASRGIETRPFFIPVHSLPPYADIAESQGVQFDETERLSRTGISLPTFNGLTHQQIDRVCDVLQCPAGEKR